MICKECGHYHKVYRRYCSECRNEIKNHTLCKECNTVIYNEEEYCSMCGAENDEYIIQKDLMNKYTIGENKRLDRKKISDNEVNKYGVRPVFLNNLHLIVLSCLVVVIAGTILYYLQY